MILALSTIGLLCLLGLPVALAVEPLDVDHGLTELFRVDTGLG